MTRFIRTLIVMIPLLVAPQLALATAHDCCCQNHVCCDDSCDDCCCRR